MGHIFEGQDTLSPPFCSVQLHYSLERSEQGCYFATFGGQYSSIIDLRPFREPLMILLMYVPPKCTSKVHLADVFLNKPFKNYYSRSNTVFLMNQVKEHLANNEQLSTFNFNMLITAMAAPALQWLVEGYDKLCELDHQPGRP